MYRGKYPIDSELDNRSDSEKVIDYFTSLYGDEFTLVQIASCEHLENFYTYNALSKEFVLDIIRTHLTV